MFKKKTKTKTISIHLWFIAINLTHSNEMQKDKKSLEFVFLHFLIPVFQTLIIRRKIDYVVYWYSISIILCCFFLHFQVIFIVKLILFLFFQIEFKWLRNQLIYILIDMVYLHQKVPFQSLLKMQFFDISKFLLKCFFFFLEETIVGLKIEFQDLYF